MTRKIRVLDNAEGTRNNINFLFKYLPFFINHFGIVVADLYRILARDYPS